MSKLRPRKQNNMSFKESFDHVEPYIMDRSIFKESFNHEEPPAMTLNFTESFEA